MQYEEDWKNVYRDMRNRMLNVPKRRRESVAEPINRVMNTTYQWVLAIDEDPVKGQPDAAKVRLNAIRKAQESLQKIQKPLYVYWNICNDPNEPGMKPKSLEKRVSLCKQLNGILKTLHAMQIANPAYDKDKDSGVSFIRYYDGRNIQKAQFLMLIQELHRMTHGKLLKVSAGMRDAEGEMIRMLVDDVWYHALEGNRPPENAEDVKRRAEHFSIAIGEMYKMERPMLSLMNTECFSNREMNEWIELLRDSNRFLQAVQRSDKERFQQ